MEQKAYAEAAKTYVGNANIWRAYDRNDRHAGEVVDGEVRKRMGRTGEGYSDALRGLRREHSEAGYKLTSRPRPEVNRDAFVGSGTELAAIVSDLQKSGLPPKGRSYLEDACHMNPAMAAKYGYHLTGVDAHELLNYYAEGSRDVRLHAQSASSRLWNLISGNKLPDGSIDWTGAARAAKLTPALAKDAARAVLSQMASNWISQQGLPGPTQDHRATALAQVRRQNPELGKMADDGNDVTAEALKQAFPQHVKTRGKQITGVGMGV